MVAVERAALKRCWIVAVMPRRLLTEPTPDLCTRVCVRVCAVCGGGGCILYIRVQAGGLVLAAQEWVWLPLSSALSLGLVYAPAVAWITHTGGQCTALLA